MSEYEFTMMSEEERCRAIKSARTFLSALGELDYLGEDSYRDLFADPAARELFMAVSTKLNSLARQWRAMGAPSSPVKCCPGGASLGFRTLALPAG